ncbi:MAG: disulfide bond formation protein B, partial [Comamonadaceae bacterium]
MLNWLDHAPRRVLALICAACVGMLAFGMYLQHGLGLEPCPMCIVQRYALILVAVCAALASARSQKGWQIGWGVLALLAAG